MTDPRRVSIWKIGGRSQRSSRMDAARDATVAGRRAGRSPATMAATPMVAVGAVSDQHAVNGGAALDLGGLAKPR